MDWPDCSNYREESERDKVTFPVGSASREIHVISIYNRTGCCFVDSALCIGVARLIGEDWLSKRGAIGYKIDSFKIIIVGVGILWREFERKPESID